MLTKADDFPIHQTPEPIAYSGTDRNFYDRYFFNGYSPDGEVFFAAAMGIYPHLNIIDAAFSVIRRGVQSNLHGSRVLNMERLDTQVGPIAIDVIRPLEELRLTVAPNSHGISASLTFHATIPPIEEPRFTLRSGPRTLMDYTRLTQNGRYTGWIEIDGERIELETHAVRGTRDRSWGVRPIGMSDPQPVVPMQLPQFFWLWAPLNFEGYSTFYHLNARADGSAWNTRGVIVEAASGSQHEFDRVVPTIRYRSGTRRIAGLSLEYLDGTASRARIEIEPKFHFYMPGIGYMHPEWGHGHYKGDLAVGFDRYDRATADDSAPGLMHIQAWSTAQLHLDGRTVGGQGVLEQLIVGPHAPSGFQGLLDPHP